MTVYDGGKASADTKKRIKADVGNRRRAAAKKPEEGERLNEAKKRAVVPGIIRITIEKRTESSTPSAASS